jgi:hypothetical protein
MEFLRTTGPAKLSRTPTHASTEFLDEAPMRKDLAENYWKPFLASMLGRAQWRVGRVDVLGVFYEFSV